MIDIKNTIELAKLANINEIHQIFIDVTKGLRSMGVNQWDFSYPNKEIITDDIKSKSCYIIKIKEQIAAVVSLNEDQDVQYKNVNWKAAESGIWVIHRLAVNPTFQNKGIASKLCAYLEELVKAENGKAIRLDAYSENPYSNKMYLKLGYKLMNEYLYFHNNPIPFNAYEKIL